MWIGDTFSYVYIHGSFIPTSSFDRGAHQCPKPSIAQYSYINIRTKESLVIKMGINRGTRSYWKHSLDFFTQLLTPTTGLTLKLLLE